MHLVFNYTFFPCTTFWKKKIILFCKYIHNTYFFSSRQFIGSYKKEIIFQTIKFFSDSPPGMKPLWIFQRQRICRRNRTSGVNETKLLLATIRGSRQVLSPAFKTWCEHVFRHRRPGDRLPSVLSLLAFSTTRNTFANRPQPLPRGVFLIISFCFEFFLKQLLLHARHHRIFLRSIFILRPITCFRSLAP